MSDQVALHDLINYIRDELLTPYRADSPEKLYPFLSIDEVELELSVAISASVSGSGQLSIQVLELGGSKEKTKEQGHTMRIKMSPILTKEEIREQLQQDKNLWEKITKVSRRMLKDTNQAGPRE